VSQTRVAESALANGSSNLVVPSSQKKQTKLYGSLICLTKACSRPRSRSRWFSHWSKQTSRLSRPEMNLERGPTLWIQLARCLKYRIWLNLW